MQDSAGETTRDGRRGAHPRARLRDLGAARRALRRDRRRGAAARLPPYRHRAGLRQRGRGRRRHPRLRRSPRDEIFVTTKVRPQLIADGAAAAIGRGEPEAAAGRRRSTCCSSTGPIRRSRSRESMRGARRREAPRPDAPYRRLEFHDRQARRGDARLAGADRHQPDRIPSLSRPDEGCSPRSAGHGLAITAYCPIALGKVVGDPVLGAIARGARQDARPRSRCAGSIQQGDVIAIPRTSKAGAAARKSRRSSTSN